jgi:uncharacterized membrane protein YedE/YeeE
LKLQTGTDAGCTFVPDIHLSKRCIVVGGVLIGFGTRYAGGCFWSRHFGLSNQIPSLKAVIGFFIGGLIMSYFLFP